MAAVLPVVQPSVAQAATTFVPVADTYAAANRPDKNYGSRTHLRTDASPERLSYIKFDVQGIGVVPSAALRVYAQTSNSVGFQVYAVADTTWDESLLTYNNRPLLGALLGSSGPVSSGNSYTIDVSAAVTGDGLVTLAVTSPSSTATRYGSRESANPAELLIPAPGVPTQYVVSRSGATYSAVEQTNGTTYTGDLKDVVEQATLDLDAAGGGTVTFQNGVFDLGGDHFELNNVDNVIFEGQGIDVTTIQNSTSAATDTEVFDITVAHAMEIRDMTVFAGGSFRSTSDAIDCDTCDDVVIENVKITGSRSRGIVFDGKNLLDDGDAVRNTIRNCIIVGIPSDGIEILGSSDNTIDGCQILDVGGHGIQIVKSSSSAAQPNKKSNDNLVTNNHIDNSGLDGINIISSDRNRVIGNTVLNSSDDAARRDGIRIQSTGSFTCDDNEVDQNLSTDLQSVKTQRYGLNISSSECNRTVVGDNNFTGNLRGDINDLGTDTIYTNLDTEPPTVPTNLIATSVTEAQVDLQWDPSMDNVGVDSYTIYRDGSPIDSVGGGTTNYQDTTVAGETSYVYEVEAFDAAGNGSGKSDPLNVTTPGDTESPTVPTNLIATTVTHAQVDLQWDASSDNVGVDSYTIYRDGSPIDSVGGGTTNFQDTTVAADTTYVYEVEAFDAAGNGSGKSSPPLNVTTTGAPSSFTFITVGDSYVSAGDLDKNYGSRSSIRADGSPIRNAYLRFAVTGVVGTVTSATLRVYANSGSSVGADASGVPDNLWDELGITFNNAPAIGGSVGFSGSFSSGQFIEWDVTVLVSGDGTYSFAVTTPHTTAISFSSREGANPAELFLQVAP